MKYETLNDAEHNGHASLSELRHGTTKVWYMRPAQWSLRAPFDPGNPEATHVLLGEIAGTDLEVIFGVLQGEIWSPEGEARDLIRGKGLRHTSISVGDVVQIDDAFFICDVVGWKEVKCETSSLR